MDQQQMIEKLNTEIDQLVQSRDQLVQQANQQIAHINGRIEAKKEMVSMLASKEEEMPDPNSVNVREQVAAESHALQAGSHERQPDTA